MITLNDHNKRTKSLKRKGSNLASAVNEHFQDTVKLFYGEGNRNIQLINDCIDIAKVTKGMRVKGASAWFAEMIPHVRDGNTSYFGAQVADKRAKYDTTWEEFLEKNPNWYDFTEEQVKEDWNYINYCKSQHKNLNSRLEKGELTLEQFEQVKKFFGNMKLDGDTLSF